MSRPFLLCDPGLLVAPDSADIDQGLLFWPRVIAWAADRRVRLGPAGQSLVLDAFCELGWPTYEPPGCPLALQRSARRAVNTLLAQVAVGEEGGAGRALDPAYEGPVDAGPSIAADASALHDRRMVGLATTEEHWPPYTTRVAVRPPPPASLWFAIAPQQQLPGEVDHAVSEYLASRRIIIVGGECSEPVVGALRTTFDLCAEQVVWMTAAPRQRLNLSGLDGLRAEKDIVYCITGFISHAGSQATDKKCRKRGVRLREVRYATSIADDLRSAYGQQRR